MCYSVPIGISDDVMNDTAYYIYGFEALEHYKPPFYKKEKENMKNRKGLV